MKKIDDIKLEKIKYVYFDMDGTLLDSNKKPLPRTLDTLKKLQNMGISCSIATGRPYYFAHSEINILKPHLPVISCNGALVYDSKSKQIISFNEIDKNVTKSIFDILIKNDAVFLIYTKDVIFRYKNNQTNPTSKWFNIIDGINSKFAKEDQTKIEQIDPSTFDIAKWNVIKFLIIYSEIDQTKYNQIESDVNKFKEVYIVRSQNEVFDIMPSGLSKGNGLEVLHNKKIIDLNHTLVFGDAENDISMFKKARWSVAMGNAQEKTKEVASYITDDNNNDGIANFFEKLFSSK